MFAIIRIRGPINVNKDIEHTMKLLNLTRSNHCVIFKEDEKIKGMVNKARGYVTWGEIETPVLEKLLTKRGKIYDKDGKLNKLKDVYDASKIAQAAKDLIEGKKTLQDLGIKPVFRLKPPSKGYERKGIKKTINEGGAIGYRKEKINTLLNKML